MQIFFSNGDKNLIISVKQCEQFSQENVIFLRYLNLSDNTAKLKSCQCNKNNQNVFNVDKFKEEIKKDNFDTLEDEEQDFSISNKSAGVNR